jgi:hypothetical protein
LATLNEHAQTDLSLESDAALPPSGRRPTPENAAAAAIAPTEVHVAGLRYESLAG